ncbi:30S ribosomal protein S13 [bacterium]|nr:30S ribosomal protein S13 [bacterium]
MARLAGIDLPKNKRIDVALTYLYGIGWTRSRFILAHTGIDPAMHVEELADEEIAKLRQFIDENYKVEGALRSEVTNNIKRLIDIKCYRGMRHRSGLPVRGQRTRDNARTRKGPRPRIGGKKK